MYCDVFCDTKSLVIFWVRSVFVHFDFYCFLAGNFGYGSFFCDHAFLLGARIVCSLRSVKIRAIVFLCFEMVATSFLCPVLTWNFVAARLRLVFLRSSQNFFVVSCRSSCIFIRFLEFVKMNLYFV